MLPITIFEEALCTVLWTGLMLEYRKRPLSTLYRTKTPKPIGPKNCTIDYVDEVNQKGKGRRRRPRGRFSPYGWNIQLYREFFSGTRRPIQLTHARRSAYAYNLYYQWTRLAARRCFLGSHWWPHPRVSNPQKNWRMWHGNRLFHCKRFSSYLVTRATQACILIAQIAHLGEAHNRQMTVLENRTI